MGKIGVEKKGEEEIRWKKKGGGEGEGGKGEIISSHRKAGFRGVQIFLISTSKKIHG